MVALTSAAIATIAAAGIATGGKIFASKYFLLAIVFMILYITGGFKIITQNPALLIFGLVAIVVLFSGGKKK